MKTIFEESIEKLAPNLLKKNKRIILSVVEKLYQKHIIENLKKLVLMDRIDELEEYEIDILAKEVHVDFYDNTLKLEEKRELVKLSLETHIIKGTPGSIQKILNIFFKGAKIVEWFDCEGESGTFKVDISDATITQDIETVLRMIESTKRKSQHISELIKNTVFKNMMNYHSGIYTHHNKSIKGDFRV